MRTGFCRSDVARDLSRGVWWFVHWAEAQLTGVFDLSVVFISLLAATFPRVTL
ncbi:hypothetical protein GLIP_3645 [Aliiglaciecola lipolytica E3]|uniref:Uncharacterized protein n=1 Tax=Aliiglaciecola lipolytica E3 TaxID=1127673 RepID=K6XX86_9ALTE|nr:hypothetical protein GLIP_3645 [Aliiglaciecola lipolytica E3]